MIGPAASALLAETRRRPGRLLLTGLAVTVATVFAAGTLLLSETLRTELTASSIVTPTAAAVVVVPQQADPGDLVARLAAVPGVTDAVGVWDTYLPVGGGTSWLIASDPMSGPLSRLAAPSQGRLPAGPDEVAIGPETAARTGLAPGRTITIAPGDGPTRSFTVTAVVAGRGEAVNSVVATPAALESLGGSLEQVDVAAAAGTDGAALAARIAAGPGAGEVVRTGAEQRETEAARASDSVNAVVLGVGVFAGLALVAAGVVVASTFRIVLTQRRTQLALLRCVGARRGQVIGAVLAEAVVTGLVAGVLGVAVAVLAGYGLLAALGSSAHLVVWWPGLAGALVVAVLATVLAAIGPALAAARIPPVAALGSAGAGESGSPRPGRRLVGAAVLAAAAAGLAVLTLGEGSGSADIAMVVVAVSGMVAFAALVVAGPVLVRALASTVGRVIAAVGRGPGRLAVANASEVPRRTAATISVLALGVGLTSALLVALASTQAGAEQTIAERFPTDIVVAAPDPASATAFAAQLRDDPRLVVRAQDEGVLVDPAQGVDPAAARTAVEDAAAGRPGMLVQYAGDARADLESTLGTARLIGFGLVGMTALVAVVGVGVTLMLSVTERNRETGLLRAVGLTRGGVRAMVAWEAALSGAGAALVGAVIGAAYGWLGVSVLELGTGGLSVPATQLTGLVVGVVAVAVLAAVVPAARAARVAPVRALQDA